MIDLLLKLASSILGYFAQPQIQVFYKPDGSESIETPGNSSGLDCKWNGLLVFENITDIVVINLKIEAQPKSFNVSIPQGSIKPYETIKVKTFFRKSFPRKTVEACGNGDRRYKELLPDELKHLQLLISYQNIKKWKKFYTLYRKTSIGEICTWHFKRPQLKAMADKRCCFKSS